MINRVVSTVGSFFWSFAGRGGGPRPDRVAGFTPPPQGRPERPRRLGGQGWDAQDASRGVQRSGCEGCWGGLVGGGAAAHNPGPSRENCRPQAVWWIRTAGVRRIRPRHPARQQHTAARLCRGSDGGVGLTAEDVQGGGEVGAAAGPRGVGAPAAAVGEAGSLAQREREPTGGGVTAAALGGAGECPPGQLVAPPGPGLALELVAGRPYVEDTGDAELGGGSIEGGAAGPPSAPRIALSEACVGEAVEQVESVREGVAQGVGKVTGTVCSVVGRPRHVGDHGRPGGDHLIGAGGVVAQTTGGEGVGGGGCLWGAGGGL